MKKGILIQRKAGVPDGFGLHKIRVTYRKETDNRYEGYLLRSSDVDDGRRIEIFYRDGVDMLEVGGIRASIENWREILLPLLGLVQLSDGTVLRKGDFVYGNKPEGGDCQGVFLRNNGDGTLELAIPFGTLQCQAKGAQLIFDEDLEEGLRKKAIKIRENNSIRR